MGSILVMWFILTIVCHHLSGADILDPLKKCRLGPTFNGCLLDTLNVIVPMLKDGDKKYDIAPLEPVSIPYMLYEQKSTGALQVKQEYFNSTVHNFARQTKFTKVELNLPNRTIVLELFNPLIRYEGKYKLGGKILLLQVNGAGDYFVNFHNVTVKLRLKFVENERDGGTYWRFIKAVCYTEPSKITLHAQDLVKGQPFISDEMNRLLNENWKELWEELEPSFSRIMADLFLRFVNKTYRHIPINKMSES